MKRIIFCMISILCILFGGACSLMNTPSTNNSLSKENLPTATIIPIAPVREFIDSMNSVQLLTNEDDQSSLPDLPQVLEETDLDDAEEIEEAEEKITSNDDVIFNVSQDDIELLARLTMAEAGTESEYGQRLVIDTVLNRVDHPRFPDNIHDVIWQKNQYSPMWSGGINKCYVREDLLQLVKEELNDRTNCDVIFFRTNHYHKWGTPMFKVGTHYFSSY